MACFLGEREPRQQQDQKQPEWPEHRIPSYAFSSTQFTTARASLDVDIIKAIRAPGGALCLATSPPRVPAGPTRLPPARGDAGAHALADQLAFELLRFADESGDIWGTYLTASTHQHPLTTAS